MAEAHKLDWQAQRPARTPQPDSDMPVQLASPAHPALSVHPSWLRLIRFCSELGHGELEKLKIQDGLPVIAEVTTRKVKFSP